MVSKGKLWKVLPVAAIALAGGAALAYERNELNMLRAASEILRRFGMQVKGTSEADKARLGRDVLTAQQVMDPATQYDWNVSFPAAPGIPPDPCVSASLYGGGGGSGRQAAFAVFKPGPNAIPPDPCTVAHYSETSPGARDGSRTLSTLDTFRANPAGAQIPPDPCLNARFLDGGPAGAAASMEVLQRTTLDAQIPPDPCFQARVALAGDGTSRQAVAFFEASPSGGVYKVADAAHGSGWEANGPPATLSFAIYMPGELAPCVRIARTGDQITVTTETLTYVLDDESGILSPFLGQPPPGDSTLLQTSVELSGR